ncbi:MAG: 4-(cytidine 5'-diphospho)-2-C-methyl-D-erythritol kinase [Candidatus Izemoplasmatales bacterium]|jgi:4-diphosphocytidyl-2-C-methyl-D-erythritol kinase|nr:4-(cytidine 5'-diphospho)-2-C-methyl-D-erythritol kinase [Candidatus Izemoplasmatales bacterium]
MITEKAYAKVNLFINVQDLRKDGYHNLEMVNVKINLFDTIKLEEIDSEGLVLVKSNDLFLSNQNNIVFDTAAYMMHQYVGEKGIVIEIDKNIPFGAGLAGNSADAASIIKGINRLFDLNLSNEEMSEIGIRFGADVPYCLNDGPAIVEGVGELVTKIDLDLSSKQLFLLNPRIYIQTKDIFTLGDRVGFDTVDSKGIRQAIQKKDINSFISNMHNSLQQISLDANKDVQLAYDNMVSMCGTTGLIMTGSGSTLVKIIEKGDLKVNEFMKKFHDKYFMNIYNFL